MSDTDYSISGFTGEQVELAAEAIRSHQMQGKFHSVWADLPNARKAGWIAAAQAALKATQTTEGSK